MVNNRLLVATAFALAFGAAAHAGTVDFVLTGAAVDYTIPKTGDYAILAFGAQGGGNGVGAAGGLGAEIGGQFLLNAGDALVIAVGGQGDGFSFPRGAGGGGGSFVVDATTGAVLAAAGGGGGAGIFVQYPGGSGQTTTSGEDGVGDNAGAGGANGMGGGGGLAFGTGGGGGGFLGAGGGDGSDNTGVGGGSWPGLAGGDFGGGFGGGGGTAVDFSGGGGGGGGGYRGGGGGGNLNGGGGGGGGSYLSNVASNPLLIAGVELGNGLVTITSPAISIPEPATWVMLLLGFPGLGFSIWRTSCKSAPRGEHVREPTRDVSIIGWRNLPVAQR
jgi:hypothetical protein